MNKIFIINLTEFCNVRNKAVHSTTVSSILVCIIDSLNYMCFVSCMCTAMVTR